jgi:hypothetical protein
MAEAWHIVDLSYIPRKLMHARAFTHAFVMSTCEGISELRDWHLSAYVDV